MKIKKMLAIAAVISVAVAGSASALTVKMNGPAAGSYENVYLNVAGLGSGNVPTGAFSLQDRTPASNNQFKNFVAFCLDLASPAPYGKRNYYSLTDTPFMRGVNLLTNGAIDRIQALFDANFSQALATDSSITSAAFQVALWNAVYDTDYDASIGSFKASGNTSVVDLANSYLAAASAYAGGDKKWDLSYLENTNRKQRQNLVTASAVPLPAAGLMLLGALGGLTLLRRRRQTTA